MINKLSLGRHSFDFQKKNKVIPFPQGLWIKVGGVKTSNWFIRLVVVGGCSGVPKVPLPSACISKGERNFYTTEDKFGSINLEMFHLDLDQFLQITFRNMLIVLNSLQSPNQSFTHTFYWKPTKSQYAALRYEI